MEDRGWIDDVSRSGEEAHISRASGERPTFQMAMFGTAGEEPSEEANYPSGETLKSRTTANQPAPCPENKGIGSLLVLLSFLWARVPGTKIDI